MIFAKIWKGGAYDPASFKLVCSRMGRKKGYRKSAEQMKEQYVEEIKLLKKGISLNNITKITGTSKNTLLKLKNL